MESSPESGCFCPQPTSVEVITYPDEALPTYVQSVHAVLDAWK